jgi:hypothetical protein
LLYIAGNLDTFKYFVSRLQKIHKMVTVLKCGACWSKDHRARAAHRNGTFKVPLKRHAQCYLGVRVAVRLIL